MDFLNSLRDVIVISILISLIIGLVVIFAMMLINIPFVPTRKKIMQKMLDAAKLEKKDIIFDLGSGDGRFIRQAAGKGIKKAVGFEVNLFLFLWSWSFSKILKQKNAFFIYKSFWKADLSKATKVFVYLLPSAMQKLEEKIFEEANDGLIVISNTFRFKKLEPIQVYEKEKIYVYEIKTKGK
jgi:hypothetical protein